MIGILYIVATPIGNLSDISLRALDTLKSVDLILAEDTRVTSKLLNHYQIDKPLLSYHQHSSQNTMYKILNTLLQGKSIALVTDAGTPGISDPGGELIEFLLENEPNIKIVPIPGASSLSVAMSVSGLRLNKFVFLGFLPKKKRKKIWEWIKEGKASFGFFESPFRIVKTLEELEKEFGVNTNVFIARELTKMHETLYRGTIGEILGKMKTEKIKGEIVVIVEV